MFLCSIFLRLPKLLSTTQAYEQKTKTTIIILSSLVALIGIGITTGFITFNPIDKSKPSYAKDQQCFEELKAKLTPDEMMEIMKKKTMTQSHCDFL